jgi:hypothetical protein
LVCTLRKILFGLYNQKWVRWAGHVADNGGKEGHRGLWCGNLMERDHVEDLGLDGRRALRLIFKIWDGED